MNKVRTEEAANYKKEVEHLERMFDEEQIIKKALEICESRLRTFGQSFCDVEVSENFFKLKLMNLESERFDVAYLNSQHKLIDHVEHFQGTIDSASVYPREIVKMALKLNASAVILAHNHPSGNTEPSQADIAITKKISDILNVIEVRVLDHIIVGGNKTVSFANRGLI